MDSRSIKEGKYREDEGVKLGFFMKHLSKEEAIEKQKDHSAGFYFPYETSFKTKTMKITHVPIALLALGSIVLCDLRGQEKKLIEALVKVGAKGKGNEEAVRSWPAVRKLNASSVPSFLEAMNKANDLGDNWIRSAISEILDRDQAGFPEKEILAFLKADQNTGSSRKFAFEIIPEYKPKLAQSLAPSLSMT